MFSSLVRKIRSVIFQGSKSYWEKRYASGGNSGMGSYGKVSNFKARILNEFVESHSIKEVIEFGCGDGHQLSLYKFSNYLGLDVSQTSIRFCSDKFSKDDNKEFALYCIENKTALKKDKWELSLSIDVLYHLVEDEVYEQYMLDLFEVSNKYVIIYSYDTDASPTDQPPHVKLRLFTEFVATRFPNWKLQDQIKNEHPDESNAQFYIYAKE